MADVDQKLNQLCKRMGRLWSDKIITNVAPIISSKQINDGSFTLIGHLVTNPRINFQAFQNTMRKAWRLDNVEFKPLEEGIFAIIFQNATAKKRVIDQGPWSFSNNLLILKQWEPNTTALDYNFDTCDFWIHVLGIPFEWNLVDLVREVAGSVGLVQEVRLEEKNMVSYGRARVTLDLSVPLQSGTLAENGNKKTWLDFKYERLPLFCFSCGRIGHAAVECVEIPFKEEGVTSEEQRLFGPWLKAEVAMMSPFRVLFLQKQEGRKVAEETRQMQTEPAGQLVVFNKAESSHSQPKQTGFSLTSEFYDGKRNTDYPAVYTELDVGDAVKVNTGNQLLADNSGLPDISFLHRPNKKISQKMLGSKKIKRFSPYNVSEGTMGLADEGQLLETPIHVVDGMGNWALVTSPNKPPGDR